MATSTYLQIYGFYHLQFQKVACYIGGLDCGDAVVGVDGSVVVAFGADAGGLMTPTYLAGLSPYTGVNAANAYFDDGTGTATWYVVPIVIGPAYTSRGKLMRPITEVDIKSPQGAGLGKTRRVHQVAAMFLDTAHVDLGTNFTDNLLTASFTNTTPVATDMFSGVHWTPDIDDPSFEGQACWNTNRPGPLTISAITSFIETSEH